jgi:hypothetical protein
MGSPLVFINNINNYKHINVSRSGRTREGGSVRT